MSERKKPEPKRPKGYVDSWQALYLSSHTITRAEYYRRTENAERPYDDGGIQLHNRNFTPVV